MNNMYYIKFGKRINMFAIGEFNKYFDSKQSMEQYKEKFNKYLYAENDYFIIEDGIAQFNNAGILVP